MARPAEITTGASSARLASGALRSGSVIAERYRLERPIGTGGMATIWEGTHLALNRPVAVKFIDIAGPNTPKMRERFLREARVAAAVRHRNVVDIVDFGTGSDGSPFMVMELLVGHSLAARLESGVPLGVAETVGIMARVLSGLAAVHDAGIVHRDLKPENVFIVADADGSYPKLLDFGVSRALDPGGALQSVLPTMENAIVGTPQYMSPEQARGLRNLDHRSDLWSAGVMLYELLTGTLPFDSDAVGDILIQIATADPPALSTLRPDLSGPLEQVVAAAMQRKPDERFQSAREMRTALLTAAARTAAALRDRPHRERASPSVATISDLPPIQPKELLDAVGDALEPGESGLLDLTELAELEPESVPPPPATQAMPPPPRVPALEADAAARVFGAPPSAGPAPPPARRRGLYAAVASGAVVAAAATAIALAWPAAPAPEPSAPSAGEGVEPSGVPEPAPTVSVRLEGVPEGATVTVDGAPRELPIVLERGEAQHRIEVRDGAGETWSVTHLASADGAYDVALERPRAAAPPIAPRAAAPSGEAPAVAPEPAPSKVRLAPPPRRSATAARRPEPAERTPQRDDGLLRDPGF